MGHAPFNSIQLKQLEGKDSLNKQNSSGSLIEYTDLSNPSRNLSRDPLVAVFQENPLDKTQNSFRSKDTPNY